MEEGVMFPTIGRKQGSVCTGDYAVMLTPYPGTSFDVMVNPTNLVVLASDWLRDRPVTQFWSMTYKKFAGKGVLW